MHNDIDRILISHDRIAHRVRELATQITADHAAGEIVIIPVLTGAIIFCADLIRCLPMPMRIGMLAVSSYPGKTMQSGGANLTHWHIGDIRGKRVVLIDDILDSGSTLRLVRPQIQAMQPASLKTAVLLRKDRPAAREVQVDYVGFDIPGVFVVGYGLDYNDYYRNLPDIVTLKRAGETRT